VVVRLAVALVGLLLVACASAGPSTPSGGVRVSGVLLVPAEPSLRESCLRAAAVGGFVVPCPRLILEHRRPVGESCPESDFNARAGGKDCLEDSAVVSPSLPSRRDAFTYVQNDIVLDGGLHLFVVGVKEDSPLAALRSGCIGPESTEAGSPMDGAATTWVECPDSGGMHAGHVLLRWTRGGVIYAVSLHGHTAINRQVELAIARSIEYVAP
jgi:hypothetical protein